jgi:D-alanine-D-alanine ligase
MLLDKSPKAIHTEKQLLIWVLAPHLETSDPNIDYYYDFTQSIEEYTRVFAELELEWKWQPVTLQDYRAVIDGIAAQSGDFLPVILNLCDGDEINGTPGISVVNLLHEKRMLYTGADAFFYHVTTSKITMKQAFEEAGIATAPWAAIHSKEQDLRGTCEKLGTPLLIKPAVSGGSMGVSVKNVVHDDAALAAQAAILFNGYRGWDLTTDGLLAETFINGPEYTAFIVGAYDCPAQAHIYTPIERVFHASLPDEEKFLSFDRLWEIYEEEKPIGDYESFYTYEMPDPAIVEAIKQLSWEAYCSVKGQGYGRIDIRQDKATGKLYVLEVNAQCGISDDEDFTSIGAILRVSGKTFTQLVSEIIDDALNRSKR